MRRQGLAKKRKLGLSGMGIVSEQTTVSVQEDTASGSSWIDSLANLAEQYYTIQAQKDQLEANAALAKQNAAIAAAQANAVEIESSDFAFLGAIDPTAAMMGVGLLLGLLYVGRQ